MSTPRRSGRRREAPNAGSQIAIGAAVLGILFALAWIAANAQNGLPLRSYRTFYAHVPDIGNLQPHDDVRIRGLRVGQVVGFRVRAGSALMTLQLNGGGPLPAGTTASVRGQGLLGQRYVELTPGPSDHGLRPGATLGPSPVPLTLGVPDALNILDRQTRGALGDSLQQLGAGLLGRGQDLREALGVGPVAGSQFVRIVDAILARPGSAGRLIPALDSATASLDGARQDLAHAITASSAALQPFYDRRRALRQTLVAAPPALAAAQSGLQRGQQLLGAAQDLADAVNYALPSAPQALRLTTSLLRVSPQPLHRLDTLLRNLSPTAPAVLRITSSLDPLLTPVQRAIDYLQSTVELLGHHGCDIRNFTANWRSALGSGIPAPDGGALLPDGRIGGLGIFRVTALADPQIIQGDSAIVHDPNASKNVYPAACRFAPGPAYGRGS